MSTHDRGAFGALPAEAKAADPFGGVRFEVDFRAGEEDERRWVCMPINTWGTTLHDQATYGRTGEEALRRLVEKLRG